MQSTLKSENNINLMSLLKQTMILNCRLNGCGTLHKAKRNIKLRRFSNVRVNAHLTFGFNKLLPTDYLREPKP